MAQRTVLRYGLPSSGLLSTAGVIQATLLEIPPLSVSGLDVGARTSYAGAFGGDSAAVGVSNGVVYACIADISGKGTPAALFSALLKYLLDEALRQDLRGDEVVNYINASVLKVLPPERFLTLIYVEIDHHTGLFQYVNAGHPEALLCRQATQSLDELRPTNEIIGLTADLRAEMAKDELRDGDALVLYTDGATDSRDLNGNRLGEGPIRELARTHSGLKAQAMADAIVADMQARTDPQRRDDLSVICIRRAV